MVITMPPLDTTGDQSPATLPLPRLDNTALQSWAQNNVYSSDNTVQQALSKTEPTAIESGKSSGLDGTHNGTSADVRHILGDFGIDGGHQPYQPALAQVQTMLGDIQHQAYTSHDAAVLTVANKLADDQNLTRLLAGSTGLITKES